MLPLCHLNLTMIFQGTIVEWVASVGQMVNEDDVVAMVETDKVTVDIKADFNGVLTQQFGAV
jgi:2-oxoglutarate dehydrogenase E2 component (dihydrolipoamide succinyltransferase)